MVSITFEDVLKELATMDDLAKQEFIKEFKIEREKWWKQYSKELIEGVPGAKEPIGILNCKKIK